MDLTELRIETFAKRIGETFRDAGAGIAYELLAVEDLTELARNVPEGARAPFSLRFRGPVEPLLPQGIRELSHDELGELGIFLVPVAREPDGIRYEAVFT